jgi:hypothetical protein
MSEATETQSVPESEQTHAALARILNLSIFFVGIGVFSAAGLALQQTDLLASYELTYFTVGVVVGVVGLLLWLVSR